MRYLVLFLSLFILSSCFSSVESPPNHSFSTKEKQIIFFSDASNIKNERNYYDALLELKSKYPLEISKMKVISMDSLKEYPLFSDTEFPSLIVIYDNKVLAKIEGIVEKEKILKPIDKVLSN